MNFFKELYKREWIIILVLLLVCAVFYFLKLGSYSLVDVDEPRYAEAAKEILKSHDWITPYFNYEVRFDKPIFFYWLIAISYLSFGITEFAARFPSVIMAFLLVFSTYYFGKKTFSKSYGLISALILASNVEFITLARTSITDMTLAFFICASIFSGFLGSFLEESRKKTLFWWAAYFFGGIAVLTKGPVGIVLPAIILGSYFILTGKLKENLKIRYIIPGIFIFFITALPWYYFMMQKHGMAFIDYFFLKHNLQRFASSEFRQHQQPFYFYLPVILGGFFPWSFYFIFSFVGYLKKLYKNCSNRFLPFKFSSIAVFKDSDIKTRLILFNVIYFLVVFFLF